MQTITKKIPAVFLIMVLGFTILSDAIILSGLSAPNMSILPLLWPVSLFNGVISSPAVYLVVVIPAYYCLVFSPLLFFNLSRKRSWLVIQALLLIGVIVIFFLYGKALTKTPFV